MQIVTKLPWILSFVTLTWYSNAYAMTSTGVDGALFVNSATTINVFDNQIFNFTNIDITQNGILNFSGLSENQTFSMLASGNINIGGILNLSSNAIFNTPNSFIFDGNIFISTNSILTVNANNIVNNGVVTFTNPVPEPASYKLLLVGGIFLALARRKLRI